MIEQRLAWVLWAVALCALISGLFACAACLLATFWPPTREAVTTRRFVLMTLWGTAFVFAGALLPVYL